jgi:tRNA (cytidine/uridine-2'-O-)-methyltransferase
MRSLDLSPHALSIALIHPRIAPNTGNIARLCVATGTHLHLVRPLGFVLSDQQLRRSAMDYWPRLKLTVHDDADAFFIAMAKTRRWLFSTKATRSVWDADFRDGDCLVFGSETHGLPESWIEREPEQSLRIPQSAGERCLNLSTAVGIGLFECLRKLHEPRQASGQHFG